MSSIYRPSSNFNADQKVSIHENGWRKWGRSVFMSVGAKREKRGVERGGKGKGVKKRGLGISVCLPDGALCRAREHSVCAVKDRNHRGSQNKLRGRRDAHTHTLDNTQRREAEERKRHTPADGGAEPKKRHYSVTKKEKKERHRFPLLFFSCFSGGGKEKTGVLIDMDLFIYLSIDFALISDPR